MTLVTGTVRHLLFMGSVVLVVAALVAGCNSSSQPQGNEKYQGREDTRKLEGASAVGYDGTAIRKNVDSSLNKSDDHSHDLDKAVKSGSEADQKQ